jgi:hypothetical protein
MLDLSSSFQLTTAFRQLLPLRVGLLHGFQKVTTWNDGSPGPWKWWVLPSRKWIIDISIST